MTATSTCAAMKQASEEMRADLQRAKEVLGKVAKVVNDKPEIEFMVEGHTDNVPIKIDGIEDNWDLSIKRATSVIRILQKDFGVSPERMTAAGRSYYIPLVDNDNAAMIHSALCFQGSIGKAGSIYGSKENTKAPSAKPD